MNQSILCAVCATCCATVIMPGAGAKSECSSVNPLVDRLKNSCADASSPRHICTTDIGLRASFSKRILTRILRARPFPLSLDSWVDMTQE